MGFDNLRDSFEEKNKIEGGEWFRGTCCSCGRTSESEVRKAMTMLMFMLILHWGFIVLLLKLQMPITAPLYGIQSN
jgi:hypothetical protein